MKTNPKEKTIIAQCTTKTIGFCFILSMLLVSCTGQKGGKEKPTYLNIKIERDDIQFVDVSTNQVLSYDKLIIFGKKIDRVYEAIIGGRATLGVAVTWREIIPPKISSEQFTRIIGHSELEKNMKYTLVDGVLTIDVP
jgi:hypothetical protein